MSIKFVPSPGIALIEEIKEDDSSIQLQLKSKNRTVRGKVVAMGTALKTDFGTVLERDWYASVGDVVYFLSYEGNYDVITISGKDYYVVKFQDLRGVAGE